MARPLQRHRRCLKNPHTTNAEPRSHLPARRHGPDRRLRRRSGHRLTSILNQHCERAGRDPNTIEHVLGSFSDTLGLADDLADAGVAELTFRVSGPDCDLGELREAIQWRDRYNATAAG